MRKKRIAFATCQRLPRLTPDDRDIVTLLQGSGCRCEPVVWSDPLVDWGAFDVVVMRSVWDYHLRYNAFHEWLGMLEESTAEVINPVATVRWNSNKKYLAEIESQGIATVPSVWFDNCADIDLAGTLAEKGWTSAVMKPLVAASAYATLIVDSETNMNALMEDHKKAYSNGVVIQRFVSEIQSAGEWSLVFLSGRFSHAVLKKPRRGDFRVQTELGGTAVFDNPPEHLIETAHAILKACNYDYRFARVDGVIVGDEFLLMEVELIEPDLFLSTNELRKRFVNALELDDCAGKHGIL